MMKKSYRHLASEEIPLNSEGTFISIGWIRTKQPLLHPIESLRFYRLWRRLKRELDAAPGLTSFEYRLTFRPMRIGMEVSWSDQEAEKVFYRKSTHPAISKWAMQSVLTPAMRLDHLFKDHNGRVYLRGGFSAFEPGHEIIHSSPIAE